jgi:hypothetical protein
MNLMPPAAMRPIDHAAPEVEPDASPSTDIGAMSERGPTVGGAGRAGVADDAHIMGETMWLGLLAVGRAALIATSRPDESKSGPSTSRRIFARDVLIAACGLAAAWVSDGLDDPFGAVICLSTGLLLEAVCLFAWRDPTGSDPPPDEAFARRVAAALSVVITWVVWLWTRSA